MSLQRRGVARRRAALVGLVLALVPVTAACGGAAGEDGVQQVDEDEGGSGTGGGEDEPDEDEPDENEPDEDEDEPDEG